MRDLRTKAKTVRQEVETTPGLSGLARSIRASDVNRQNLLFSLAWLVNSTRL
jgi:hypothetical protein